MDGWMGEWADWYLAPFDAGAQLLTGGIAKIPQELSRTLSLVGVTDVGLWHVQPSESRLRAVIWGLVEKGVGSICVLEDADLGLDVKGAINLEYGY
jgi:hypothetical protein